jgi:hypothetical protein
MSRILELQKAVEDTQAQMNRVGAQITKIAEKEDGAIVRTEKNNQAIKANTKELTELGDQYQTLQTSVKHLQNVVKLLEKGGGGSVPTDRIEDAITAFMESKDFKTWRDEMSSIDRAMKSKALKGSFFGALTFRQAMYRRAIMASARKAGGAGVFSSTENPGLVTPYFRPDIVPIARPVLRLRQLFPVIPIPIATNAVNVDRQVVQWDWAQQIVAEAAAAATTLSLKNKGSNGLGTSSPYNRLRITDGTNEQNVTVTNIAPGATEADPDVITFAPALVETYAAGSYVHAEYFRCTPETERKPCSRHRTEQTAYSVYKIATTQKVSTEMLEDDRRAEQWLRNEMLAGVEINAEKAMLYGSGNNCHRGIFNDDDVARYDWSLGLPGSNKIDHIIDVAFEVILNHYDPTNATVYPTDLKDMFRAKNEEGGYLFFRTFDQMLPTQLTSMQLTWSTLLERVAGNAGGDFIVGDYMRAANIYDRSDSTIQIGTSGDDFTENLRTIIAEQRFAWAIERGLAMAKGTFDAEPPAP